MCNFCMAALMLLTGHGINARTPAHVEITHFPTQSPRGTQPVALCLSGPVDAPYWEMCDIQIPVVDISSQHTQHCAIGKDPRHE